MQNDAQTPISVTQRESTIVQIVVESQRPYDEVIQAFEAQTREMTMERLVQLIESTTTIEEYSRSIDEALEGATFLRLWEVDLGNAVTRYFRPFKGKEYLFGNPALAFQMINHDPNVGFYVPFRVCIYEETPGRTYLTYSQPTSLLAQFNDEEIRRIAATLDSKVTEFFQLVARGQ